MSLSLYKSTEKFLIDASPIEVSGNHRRRLSVLTSMICSCVHTRNCSLEGMSHTTQEKSVQLESQIKQAKRWLSSKWTDWQGFYAPYIKLLLDKLSSTGEITLIIDGSEMAGDCVVLMVSVVWRDYAIPLVWMAKKGEKGHFSEDVHIDVLKLAHSIVPSGCRVVLLGDGEFDGTKLCEMCGQHNWEFVLRTSTDRKIEDNGHSVQIGELSPFPGSEVVFVESALNGYNAVLWHYAEYKKPIPLLTNIDVGEVACAYYERRFKIELLFKQMKSAAFNVHKSKIEGRHRVENLIIVVALTFIITFCLGLFLLENAQDRFKRFTREDRIGTLTPVKIALKALRNDLVHTIKTLSKLATNFPNFFSASG